MIGGAIAAADLLVVAGIVVLALCVAALSVLSDVVANLLTDPSPDQADQPPKGLQRKHLLCVPLIAFALGSIIIGRWLDDRGGSDEVKPPEPPGTSTSTSTEPQTGTTATSSTVSTSSSTSTTTRFVPSTLTTSLPTLTVNVATQTIPEPTTTSTSTTTTVGPSAPTATTTTTLQMASAELTTAAPGGRINMYNCEPGTDSIRACIGNVEGTWTGPPGSHVYTIVKYSTDNPSTNPAETYYLQYSTTTEQNGRWSGTIYLSDPQADSSIFIGIVVLANEVTAPANFGGRKWDASEHVVRLATGPRQYFVGLTVDRQN